MSLEYQHRKHVEDRQMQEKSKQKSLITSRNRGEDMTQVEAIGMFAKLLNMRYEVVGKLIDFEFKVIDSDFSSLSVYAYAIQ